MTYFNSHVADARPVVVFGTGMFADLCASLIVETCAHRVVAFTVDEARMTDRSFRGLPVVAFEDLESRYPPWDVRLIIPIGYNKAAAGVFESIAAVRRARFETAVLRGYDFVSYVSPRAIVHEDLEIGRNVMIHDGTIIQPFCRIGDNTILRSGVHLSHHCRVGDHVFLAPRATTGGNVEIGDEGFLGIGSIVLDSVRIASRCVIAAGAVVTKSTEEGSIYVGNPARRRPIISRKCQ